MMTHDSQELTKKKPSSVNTKKNKDNLKNEEDLKRKGDLRNKDDLKIEDNLILKTFHCHSLLMILRS